MTQSNTIATITTITQNQNLRPLTLTEATAWAPGDKSAS